METTNEETKERYMILPRQNDRQSEVVRVDVCVVGVGRRGEREREREREGEKREREERRETNKKWSEQTLSQ